MFFAWITDFILDFWFSYTFVSNSDISPSSAPGSVGDRHIALYCAFYPAHSRRHSARSLERCGVLSQTTVGKAAGDQRELKLGDQLVCYKLYNYLKLKTNKQMLLI